MKLKSKCAFCGGKPVIKSVTAYYDADHIFSVECEFRNTTCPMNARTHRCSTEEEAIKLWETRYKPNGNKNKKKLHKQ